ncbi:MAG: peptide ABC transporter substrate-binding protein [Wenzhouxiangella sp.]
MNTRLTASCLALLVAALAGCAGQGDEDTGPAPPRWNLPEVVYTDDGLPDPSILAPVQILHRGNGTQPQGLDPHITEGVPSTHVQRDLFESLVVRSPDGRIIPGAAGRWEVSEDGLTWTFFLREDARWSNGDALTAQDWLFSLRRAVDPATGSRTSILLKPLRNAEAIIAGQMPPEELGVRVIDDYTLELTLEAPNPLLVEVLSHSVAYPVHRATVEAHGDRWARPGTMVSNGPYRLEELAMQSHIRLVRNPYFRENDRVIIDEVYYYPTEDLAAELLRYRAGEIDWTYEVPNTQFNWIEANLADELVISDWFGTYYFGFNTQREPFNDPRVTIALSLAIDRGIITTRLRRFGEQPSFSFTPPGLDGYDPPQPEWAGWTQQQREDHARQLLAEAGFGPDNPLKLEIRYNTHEDHKRVSLAIAAMWEQVLGVRASLINEEFRVFLATRRARAITEVFRSGWIGSYLEPMYFLELFHSDNQQNDVGFFSDEYDALLARAARTPDPDERFALFQQAERLLLENQPIAPVYTYVTRRLVKPYVRGWEPNLVDQHPTRYMFILRQDPVEDGEG